MSRLRSLASRNRDVDVKLAEAEAWLGEKITSCKLLTSFPPSSPYEATQRVKDLNMLSELLKGYLLSLVNLSSTCADANYCRKKILLREVSSSARRRHRAFHREVVELHGRSNRITRTGQSVSFRME